VIELWPILTWIALVGAATMSRATLRQHRSCKRHCTPALAMPRFQNRVWKLEWLSGVPFAVANTSVSGPVSAREMVPQHRRVALEEIVIERTPVN